MGGPRYGGDGNSGKGDGGGGKRSGGKGKGKGGKKGGSQKGGSDRWERGPSGGAGGGRADFDGNWRTGAASAGQDDAEGNRPEDARERQADTRRDDYHRDDWREETPKTSNGNRRNSYRGGRDREWQGNSWYGSTWRDDGDYKRGGYGRDAGRSDNSGSRWKENQADQEYPPPQDAAVGEEEVSPKSSAKDWAQEEFHKKPSLGQEMDEDPKDSSGSNIPLPNAVRNEQDESLSPASKRQVDVEDDPQAAENTACASASVTQDVRYEQDPNGNNMSATVGGQDVRYEASAASAMPCQDIRYEQGGNFGCQDVRYDASYEPPSRQGKRGQNQKKGGDNRQNDKKKKPGNSGGGGGGGGDHHGAEKHEKPAPTSLSGKIRKTLAAYEERLDINELQTALEMLEASHKAEEGCCDSGTLNQLLLNLTRAGKLVHAHKVLDIAVDCKVSLDVGAIVNIALAISQRSQSHKALRYLRRLVHECMPADTEADQIAFLDRHASFIFSELMAEADGCFGRMENRDFSTLINLGHAEPEIMMDWKKSSATQYILHNREDDNGKKIYQPTVERGGFQRTDFCLMSFDIAHPQVAARVDRAYDKIHDGAEVEVTCSSTSPNTLTTLTMKLTSPPKVPFTENMCYRLDKLASRDQTRRMLEALKTILKPPSEDGGQNSLQPAPQLRELILVPSDTTLSKVGKEDLPIQPMVYNGCAAKQQCMQSFQEESKERHGASLNQSQLQALTRACTQRITLIQGPPGTGKTTTAVQIVSALVQYGLVDLPMLVTADSNTAVDNLVKGIGKRGLSVVRVGRPESIREDVKQYALDGRWKELKKAEVVCATCIGASGTTLDKTRFGTVLIDECTQAAESAALVPIARGCQQAILIGDQCQLPPTVLSDVAETENLGESLFTRLVTQGVRPVLLDTQYRMHPLIAEFASAAFYNGRLQNGVSHVSRKPPEGFPWPQRQMPVAFVNLDRGEERREGSSYINPAEAEKTLWALQEVCKSDQIGPEEVGLVTPYKGQVNYIKKLIRERVSLAKFRTGLEVESVDGFQGQEKEVIIFCAVRNNRDGKVGFLSDWRRLNVMLTRARRGCIVIGSKTTLNQDPLWQEWLKWATARGAICGESAKGTWVPRYLVDDRDGVWQVKASIVDEATTEIAGVPVAPAAQAAAPTKEVEVLDSWEDAFSDMGSHPGSPPTSPSNNVQNSMDMPEVMDVPVGSQEEPIAVSLSTREAKDVPVGSQEEPVAVRLSTREAKESEGTVKGTVTRQVRIGSATVDDIEDEPRRSGTPNVGPKSPSRQLALAQLGLLTDLDLDD